MRLEGESKSAQTNLVSGFDQKPKIKGPRSIWRKHRTARINHQRIKENKPRRFSDSNRTEKPYERGRERLSLFYEALMNNDAIRFIINSETKAQLLMMFFLDRLIVWLSWSKVSPLTAKGVFWGFKFWRGWDRLGFKWKKAQFWVHSVVDP